MRFVGLDEVVIVVLVSDVVVVVEDDQVLSTQIVSGVGDLF
jgi:hypothetical protein